ncbi:lactonase family protein [Puia dinghuensis]|uniref:3-carboxymuconate cyclase n=1 Tax=Puia dinghuensis TaxID=1792502 RepID=A0A8J2XW84_9BACT|nr:lactonase family protein [Puia dinghuensis]GGB24399.1 3-carboxymuconate cyclase [Puia dinghuensis]
MRNFLGLSLNLILVLTFSAAKSQSYFLFVGTYTNTGNLNGATTLDSTGSKGIYVYRFDAATGEATPISHTESVCNPSYLAIAPDGAHLYACTESRMLDKGSVSAFRFDRNSGQLQFINKVSSGGDNPAYVSVNHSGNWVVVANYTGGSLSVFPVRADGGLWTFIEDIQHFGHGINPARQEKAHVHSALFSPDSGQHYLYVQDLGLDKIMIEPFDETALAPVGHGGLPVAVRTTRPLLPVQDTAEQKPAMMLSTTPGSGPRHLVFHPNGKFAYLVEELGGSVDVYRFQPATGRLDSLQRIAAHPGDAKGPFRSADIHVSPDGRFLYTSNRAETTIAIFSIDPATGLLKAVGYVPTMGTEPRNFTLDPTGKWLLVANQDSNSIVVFRVNSKTGMIKPTGLTLSVPAPTCLIYLIKK